MRVTMVIYSLGPGGAERVLVNMANYWVCKGWEVCLFTLDNGRNSPFYALDPAVRHRPLGVAEESHTIGQRIRNNLHRVRTLRSAILESAPDAVISLMSETNVLTLLATVGLRIPVLVQEQIDPNRHAIGILWNLLRRWTYPWATHVVVLGERSLNYFPARVRRRARIIPNPVFISPSRNTKPVTGRGNTSTIIAMGRLVPQKGFDLLLQAFACVAPRHPGWFLKIWGEGPLRAELEALVGKLGLEDHVCLPGLTKEAHEQFRQADIFVLSSRYEGFPVVLCEAMACGLPSISFNCPSGPEQIISSGVNGILVASGDVDKLAVAMDMLMNDGGTRRRLAVRAPEIMDRFGIANIMGMWEELIDKARQVAI